MVDLGEKTSISLLARMGGDTFDQEAWSRFLFLYGPLIVRWCRGRGLQDADARDVAQEVLLQFSKEMARQRYDPERRLRGWLRAMVRAALSGWAERGRPWDRGSGDSAVMSLMDTAAATEELTALIEEEHERELLSVAMATVARRVEPQTWQAFHLLAVEGVSGKEAAERLGMKLGSLYAAKAKVQRMVREEVEKLDSDS